MIESYEWFRYNLREYIDRSEYEVIAMIRKLKLLIFLYMAQL